MMQRKACSSLVAKISVSLFTRTQSETYFAYSFLFKQETLGGNRKEKVQEDDERTMRGLEYTHEQSDEDLTCMQTEE